MRRIPAVASLVVLSVLAFPLFAQQPTQTAIAPTLDPQALTILRRSLVALSAQSVASIQDTLIHASTTPAPNSASEPGTVTITTKGARQIRFDGSGGAKNSSMIFNAGREMRLSDKGWLNAPSVNANHKRIEHLPALMLAYEIARGDLSAAYIGEETIAARSVHHIRLARVSQLGNAADAKLTAVTQLDVFVDAQTFLIAKIAFPQASEVDWRITFPVEIVYDQYQTVNGIAVPYHQRYFVNGQHIYDLQVTSVAVNQGTPDTTFEAN